jgi:hypothetical protein
MWSANSYVLHAPRDGARAVSVMDIIILIFTLALLLSFWTQYFEMRVLG